MVFFNRLNLAEFKQHRYETLHFKEMSKRVLCFFEMF